MPSHNSYIRIKATNFMMESMSVRDEHKVRYVVGEFVEAKVGGLLVFDSLVAVLDCFGSVCISDYKFWRCECEGPVSLPRFRLDIVFGILHESCEVEKLWNPDFDCIGLSLDWPIGTSAFKRVKLLEELHLEAAKVVAK